MLLFLVCEKRKEKVIDKLVEFIYQLSMENIKIMIRTLKKLIHFIKRSREK